MVQWLLDISKESRIGSLRLLIKLGYNKIIPYILFIKILHSSNITLYENLKNPNDNMLSVPLYSLRLGTRILVLVFAFFFLKILDQ